MKEVLPDGSKVEFLNKLNENPQKILADTSKGKNLVLVVSGIAWTIVSKSFGTTRYLVATNISSKMWFVWDEINKEWKVWA